MRLVNIVLLELLVVLGAPPVAVVYSFNCSNSLYCEEVIQRLKGAGSDTVLFQGDILLSVGRPDTRRRSRAALSNRASLWPNATIPYRVGPYIARHLKENFLAAMAQWEQATCITFVEQTTEKDYIVLTQDDYTCASYIGRKKGPQEVTIGNNCGLVGNALHELGHVIGFGHEHSRPDRDHYVTINWHNIRRPYCNNFCKYKVHVVDSLGSGYDYDSIMHYKVGAFSINQEKTIIPNNNSANYVIGQRKRLSAGDIYQANKLYGCPAKGDPPISATPSTTLTAAPTPTSASPANMTTNPPATPTNTPTSFTDIAITNGSYIILRSEVSPRNQEHYMACHIILGRCYFGACSCGECGNDEFLLTTVNSSKVRSGDRVSLQIKPHGNPLFLACDFRGCSLQPNQATAASSCSSSESYILRSPDRNHGEVIYNGDRITLHLCSNPSYSINCERKRCKLVMTPVTFIIYNRSICNQGN